MLDGYYKARFTKSGSEPMLGLITLANGKLFGGNSDFMLFGSCKHSGGALSAQVQVNSLSFDQRSGMFREGGSLNIVGQGGLHTIMCNCHSPQSPDDGMQVVLERVQF